ncbi:ZCHC3 protein, partial [Polyodon spathula]|nr:ZCHC3 protein [Polyodon spathula]
ITVHMFNPYISDFDIELFLSRYCKTVSGGLPVRDKHGIWTGKRQFRVILKPDKSSSDGFKHPPANFTIGPNRGYLFYSGQPQYCRKCGIFGHLAATCKNMVCRNCQGTDHETKDCDRIKKCSICNSEEHLFKQCPK